jgi:hypothetical protein
MFGSREWVAQDAEEALAHAKSKPITSAEGAR